MRSSASPSMYSIAMYGFCLLILPWAMRRTMWVWRSCLRMFASRSKRAMAPSLPSSPSATTLSAMTTTLSSLRWNLARYTVPIAPLPSSFSISNGPIC